MQFICQIAIGVLLFSKIMNIVIRRPDDHLIDVCKITTKENDVEAR